jgi:putative endonuclease
MSEAYIYILANKKNGTLYIGVTNDLPRRVDEHKHDYVLGFTNKYQIHTLVYYEVVDDIYAAIEREKKLKRWRRQWKLELINQFNPEWRDLSSTLT